MAPNSGRVTLAVLGTKMDTCTEEIKKLQAAFTEHAQEDRLTAIDVDRLKQQALSRNKHYYVIYTALIGLAATATARILFGF